MTIRWRPITAVVALGVMSQGKARTQTNGPPNPYRTVDHWFSLPTGRAMGSTSAVFAAPDGHIWVAERCGVNSCEGSNLAPILEFDSSGKLLKSFGKGCSFFRTVSLWTGMETFG